MEKPTLEQIKLYLDTSDWYELLPSSQWECVEWLVSEVERLRHLSISVVG